MWSARIGPHRSHHSSPSALKRATSAGSTLALRGGVAFVLAPLVAEVTHPPRATDIIRVLCLGLLIDTLFHIVPSAALQRALRQDLFAVTEVGANFVKLEIAKDTEVKVQKHAIAQVMPKGTLKEM